MISGYASVFYDGSDRTEFVLGEVSGRQYVERIMPGAFDSTIGGDVLGLFNHDPNMVLGRTSAGTMRLSLDDRGLRYEIDENDTAISKDVASHQQSGNIRGSSFSFFVSEDGVEHRTEGDKLVRQIKDFSQLIDVGPVTFPAYSATEGGRSVRYVDTEGRAMDVPGKEARSLTGFQVAIEREIAEEQARRQSQAVETRLRILDLDT